MSNHTVFQTFFYNEPEKKVVAITLWLLLSSKLFLNLFFLKYIQKKNHKTQRECIIKYHKLLKALRDVIGQYVNLCFFVCEFEVFM